MDPSELPFGDFDFCLIFVDVFPGLGVTGELIVKQLGACHSFKSNNPSKDIL